MPIYNYKGLKTNGGKATGTLEANSKSTLINILKEQGIFVEEISEVSSKKRLNLLNISFSSNKHIPDIFFQLATLLKSGIVLSEAVKVVANQTSSKKLKRALFDIASKLNEGEKFSNCLTNHDNIFNDIHINIIRASENVGRLAESLENIAIYEENKQKSLEKIKLALIYPAIVLSIGLGVVGFLLSYVVPKMESIFTSVNKKLPTSTEILIGVGNYIKHYGYISVFLLIVLAFIIKAILSKNSNIRFRFDKKLSKFKLLNNINLYRFCETMSFLLNEGVVLVSSVEIAANTVKNSYYKNILKKVSEDIKTGKSFSESIKSTNEFPELLSAAIKTGEKSGSLNIIFERLSEYYLKRVEKTANIFTSTIEPIFILFLGLIVGFIVISIMSPLFELNNLIK